MLDPDRQIAQALSDGMKDGFGDDRRNADHADLVHIHRI